MSDVVYNRTSSLWACCRENPDHGSKITDCTKPGNITFQASTPETLLAEVFSDTTESSTTQPLSSSTALILMTSQDSNSSNSDIGMKAGIGLVTALLIVFLLCSLGWLIIRRRRNGSYLKSGSVLEKNGDDRASVKSSRDEEVAYNELGQNQIRTTELEGHLKGLQLLELKG